MYNFLRKIFFLFDAEKVHYFSMNMLKFFCGIPFIRNLVRRSFSAEHASFSKELFGLHFKNSVGLAAGFDKNAKYLKELELLGFGFVEIGTVTPLPQEGNPKPRLFRLPADKAIINRMGFNNDGVEVVAKRLMKWRAKNSGEFRVTSDGLNTTRNPQPAIRNSLIIGGNIGKNKITPNEDAWKDYEICFRALHPYVDYFVVNVSSPNTPGLRELQEKDALKKILVNLQTLNKSFQQQRPILLKIAPDLTWEQMDDVIDLALEINLDGLVAANTTISRDQLQTPNAELNKIGAGGLSGAPLKKRLTEIISYINKKTNGSLPVIGSGGIFTADDASEKINAGASLVQVWTGFIYEGPGIVKKILKSI